LCASVDGLVEDFYQRLMACYLVARGIGAGLLDYRRCREVLSADLVLRPAPETETLYNVLSHTLQDDVSD
jgi:DNA-binding SARP family transcriptional activator